MGQFWETANKNVRTHCSVNICITGRIKSQKHGEPNKKIIIKDKTDGREENLGLGLGSWNIGLLL